jgi:uncharacterized protein YebE (UPF0316 family)
MHVLADLPTELLAVLIFLVRVVDVSIGTLRTISVVQGRLALSVALGFCEVLIWITAISQVISGASQNPWLIFAYAGGFATGNAVGIVLERTLALGSVVVRMICPQVGPQIAGALRNQGHRVTTFTGEGRDGPVQLVYTTCLRRRLPQVLETALRIDPAVVYTVEPVHKSSAGVHDPLPYPTGWRAVFKQK